MPHIYKVSGLGRALGAKSVVLAENRRRAIRLHIRAVTAQAAEDLEETGSEAVQSPAR